MTDAIKGEIPFISQTTVIRTNSFFIWVTGQDFSMAILLGYLFDKTGPDNKLITTDATIIYDLLFNERTFYRCKHKLIQSEIITATSVNPTTYEVNINHLNTLWNNYLSDLSKCQENPTSKSETPIPCQNVRRSAPTAAKTPIPCQNVRTISSNPPIPPVSIINTHFVSEFQINASNLKQLNVNENDIEIENKHARKKRGRKPSKVTVSSYLVAEYLFDAIYERRPGFFGKTLEAPKGKEKRLTAWARAIKKIIELDGRAIEDIVDTIGWSQRNDFWKDNILSPQTLRKQYGRLHVQMEEEEKKLQLLADDNPEITAEIIKRYERIFCWPKKNLSWDDYKKIHFVKGAKHAVELANSTNLLLKNIPGYLIQSLQEWKRGHHVVEPHNLSSEYTWQVLLPQFLREIGISVCLKK